jgi:hypothetical protein
MAHIWYHSHAGRYWLEQLLRELTYISSFEQDTSVLMKAQTAVFNENQFAVVASCLEDLLFFRLGKEWSQRSELSSLLEQMQLSQSFGILLDVLHHIGSVE